MHTRQSLVRDLRALGLEAGDVVMAHASVRAIGRVAGGPDEIHLAVKDAISPGGTMFMYAGCPELVDDVGRGHLSADEEAEVLAKLPPFDPGTARSARDHGILVEFFRTFPGTRPTRHPTRFVVWGARTDELLEPQPWDFAFGHDSILERFTTLDGKILLLGSDLDSVTYLHYAEHIVDIPDKRIARFKVPVLERGVRVWRYMAEFDSSSAGVHENWPDRFFARIVSGYLAESGYTGGRVGDAACQLFRARELLEFALRTMRRVAADRHAANELPRA